MFDKLDDILFRLEEVLNQLNEPGVANDPGLFQKLMKEQAELQPIADAYQEYKNCKQTIEDSVAMLEEENDEEMREMLKEELSEAKKRVEELEQELKILLLLPTAFFGLHTRFKGVEIIRCQKAEFLADRPLPVHIDGESAGVSARVRVSVLREQPRILSG